ncbi:sugar phosphate isomerase/epimerase family protein [Streptomyces sp. TRM76323]|uniref:Sugar phosphate isomerase/epimerase family protein n=1 Tax=Streptomyces tamarix TaxID=3078565 RepID=A0ABU3QEI2_9ACTN|nr:sugar phosphate isomerase/epimerase family protein [Streptomyces tamarix]MDT9681126.1 sugar phosphate isomerase/epimerase family protein [Streptomyces tamarix]
MKFAFSTLGVPGMAVGDVVRLAGEAGCRGVELRAHPEEPVHPGLVAHERRAVAREFAAAGVDVLCVAGYARVAAEGDDDAVYEELYRLIHLAADLGAPFVRVFPGGGEQPQDRADAVAARRLGAAAEVAAETGVRILLENHDSHPAGADTARVVAAVGHPHVGVVWDVMHAWRAGEEPARTYGLLEPYLGYVQVKDCAGRDDTTPVPLGAGALPLRACVEPVGPDGWFCWEYEKRWYPDVPELPALLAAGRAHVEGLLATR